MKDNFSHNPSGYATFRPSYPDALIQKIRSLVLTKTDAVWDVGTGNGQVAMKLTDYFGHIEATDISQAQLNSANKHPNIRYSAQPAEKTDFSDNQFDLIIIGQAIHWFDFDRFYQEVYRVSKNKALIAVIGYDLIRINPQMDKVIEQLYSGILKDYWDPERKYIDEAYKTIPFPFEEIASPDFVHNVDWSLEHLLGYLNSWSAVAHYKKDQNINPVEIIREDLKNAWGNLSTRPVTFPIISKLGYVLK